LIQLARNFTSIFDTTNIMPAILGTDRGKNKPLLTIANHRFYRPLPCFLQISAGELRYNYAVYCDEIHNVVERSPGSCRLAAENHSDALTTTGYGVDCKP
jgi:hypothetical protein